MKINENFKRKIIWKIILERMISSSIHHFILNQNEKWEKFPINTKQSNQFSSVQPWLLTIDKEKWAAGLPFTISAKKQDTLSFLSTMVDIFVYIVTCILLLSGGAVASTVSGSDRSDVRSVKRSGNLNFTP